MPTSISQIISAICSFTRLPKAEENVKDSYSKAGVLCQRNSSHHGSIRYIDSDLAKA